MGPKKSSIGSQQVVFKVNVNNEFHSEFKLLQAHDSCEFCKTSVGKTLLGERLKSPSLARIKPALSADGALGGEGTEYTCFCMFIEFKLTPFPLKVQQSFHKWIFDPLRGGKKTREKEGLSFQVDSRGILGCVARGDHRMNSRSVGELWPKRSSNISAL